MKTMPLVRVACLLSILSARATELMAGAVTDNWRWQAVGRSNSPAGRIDLSAVWTGSEFLFWGGRLLGGHDDWKNDGFRYDPRADRWKAISTIGAPEQRCFHTAIWTGRELIIWGGLKPTGRQESYNTGARYNPVTDTWSPVSMVGAPERRTYHTAVWTGKEMIVWGGFSVGHFDSWNDGGRYDPATDSWKPLSVANAPYPRQEHAAIWTGKEMLVWGGRRLLEDKRNREPSSSRPSRYFIYPLEVSRYEPAADTWTRYKIEKGPSGRANFSAVWTGKEMLIWGGVSDRSSRDLDNFDKVFLNDGARFDPAKGAWQPTSAPGSPSGREHAIGLWTGSEMIIFGGSGEGNKGSRYDPALDAWTPTSFDGAPLNSFANAAAWTGDGMLVFQDALAFYFEPGLYAADQLPNEWQRRYFGENNPNGTPTADPDHDGQDNLHEYLAGTDPTDANSRFSLQIEKGSSGTKLVFAPRWDDRTYVVEVSTNLGSPSFVRAEGLKVENRGAIGSVVDPNKADPARFYRIRISLP